MNVATLRWLAGLCCLSLLGSLACERKQSAAPAKSIDDPAATQATNTSNTVAPASAEPTEADLAALRALVTGKVEKDPLAGLPPGHPPLTPPATPSGPRLPAGHPPMGAAAAPSAASDGPGLRFTPPSGWESQPVRSSLRKAQYGLPRVAGDEEDGELVVFFFGRNEGGTVRDNIERWKGQFTTPDGQPIPPEGAREETFEANGMRITTLDIAGRFMPGPGMGASGPRDNIRMLAAVIETPDGNWFIRATGPLATMQEHREAFKSFLLSVER